MKKIEFFKVEGDKINRIRKHCPKCGPGVFIAEHKDRFSCGKCGYTEFKSGGKKQQPISKEKPAEKPTKEEKPVEPEVSAEPENAEKSATEEPKSEEAEKIEDKKE